MFRYFKPWKSIALLFITVFATAVLFMSYSGPRTNIAPDLTPYTLAVRLNYFNNSTNTEFDLTNLPSITELRVKLIESKVKRLSLKIKKQISDKLVNNTKPKTCYDIQIFYYTWYKTISQDGVSRHWNPDYMGTSKKDKSRTIPTSSHPPLNEIGSNYYPQLGCYSSSDQKIIDHHMQAIKDAGIGVMILSWQPPEFPDSPSKFLKKYFESALKYGLKIALHIQNYPSRDVSNLKENLKLFMDEYGNHASLYKMDWKGRQLPLYYIFESHLVSATQWSKLLRTDGELTVRGTEYDGFFLGLLKEAQHKYEIRKAHFDGFYTYYSGNGFYYGSTWKNWEALQKFAQRNELLFVPCVGPGYHDNNVVPWNLMNTRNRVHGGYYEVAWRSALAVKPSIVAISSFNQWHEGSQIEPAIPMSVRFNSYLDYEPESPTFYLNLTRWWVNEYSKTKPV